MTDTPKINWGHNCLTSGIHHGRPEALWNLPLLYAATVLFRRDVLKSLVLERIRQDATQYSEHGVNRERFTTEWVDKVVALAEASYDNTLQLKVGELSNYYKSPEWETEQKDTAQRVKTAKLNPHYAPLHIHDSINLLCRILGTGAARKAAQELGL